MRWRLLSWVGLGLLVLAIFLRFERTPKAAFKPAVTTSLPITVKPASSDQLSTTNLRAPFAYRLSNTSKTVSQLARSETGILLENALLDTSEPLRLNIPDSFRSSVPPDTYIIQSRGPITGVFRSRLQQAGAVVVSYIPNNALLVRASGTQAQLLAAESAVQAVLPYEPYYKLKPSLLTLVLSADSAPEVHPQSYTVNVLLFADARDAAMNSLREMGVRSLAERPSPFGPVLRMRVPLSNLAMLARFPGVQEIELARQPVPANDLSRAVLGVSTNSSNAPNYLGLTGTNVLVNVNDTGVDASQPDLLGRVLSDLPSGSSDTNGHGTHVAGIIAGSGVESPTVTNAPGSSLPPASFQFRGKAPAATLFSMVVALDGAEPGSDVYLQQTAARTNAFISNNSWLYTDDSDYDLAAASFDAAARDALPGTSGSQALLFVFPAGNHGGAGNDGSGGIPGTIQSPATAKNVITVGAIEQPRFITNETWTCSTNGTCQTNTPWLPLTDSTNRVAGFSGRGNVGPGIEGEAGRFKPDVVAPGTFIISTRSTQWNQTAYYTQTNDALTPTPDANYFEVFSNLNDSLGPFYRFESGTSLAAADVSGVLALMQDFFQNRLNQTNSPALMKALLINGARSLGGNYDLHTAGPTNSQGWGRANLTNSVPVALTNVAASSRPMFLFEQSPQGGLATGQSRTRIFSLRAAARNAPLRMTLAWTDPPGNPVASLKLVNDLDLLVTNLETGEVYFGNDIAPGHVFNQSWDTNSSPNLDFANNVENVFLSPPLAGCYSVTVLGRRVNVNAVTANTNDVVQDYALVVASGNGQSDDALTLTDTPPVSVSAPLVTILTNSFLLSADDVGSVLLHQRVGANPVWPATNTVPLPGFSNAVLTLGTSNQWHFYVVSNNMAFTNAAFATFLANPLTGGTAPGSNCGAADIDLYVCLNSGLTNLDPAAIAAADKSLGRGGNETIIYTNAQAAVYYVGVKSESQHGAEYGFLNVFSAVPFVQTDAAGNQLLRGLPAPTPIPGGSINTPGIADIFGLSAQPMTVRRVIVTNVLTAASAGDLVGTLAHETVAVGLNNHATNGTIFQQPFIYDDSGEGDVPGAQPPDGPGSLRDFAAANAAGQWRLTMLDTNQPATNDSFSVFLELEPDLGGGIMPSILSGVCRQDYVFVPLAATNLTATVSLLSGSGPVSVQLCPADTSSNNCLTLSLSASGSSATLVNDATTHPPLSSGWYILRFCNLGLDVANVNATTTITSDPNGPVPVSYVSSTRVPLPDDASISSSLLVTNHEQIEAVSVGVRIEHPRVSDLVLRLLSPGGNRMLLAENRGADSTNGLGCDVLVTNRTQVSYSGGPQAVTNVLDTGETSGIVNISYDFYALPDDMHVYYEGTLIYDSGSVSNTGTTNLSFGPGASTVLTFVMNEGGNPNTNTAWFFSATCTHLAAEYLTFVEDTNLTSTPIKFAPPPLSASNYFGNGATSTNAIFYLPEEPLAPLLGRSAYGLWTLEVTDNRAGATNPPPALTSWKLDFVFRNPRPVPLPLTQGQPATNILGAGQLQWFTVQVPGWASFATNTLLTATVPINLWYNATTPPSGTNAGDFALLLNSAAGTSLLQTNGMPPLLPGSTYYLGIENTNGAAVTYALQIDFDVASVVTLQSGVPYATTSAGLPHAVDYYRYVVSTNAVRAQFEINGPSADLTLVLRRGLPLPTAASFDYRSANPDTNDELIVVYDYSSPVPLTPGDWFLGVINLSGASASYSVMATEFADFGTNLFITNPVASTNSFCLTWNSLPGVHYFVQGKANLDDAQWVTLTPTLTAADVSTTYCVPLPSRFHFFRVHEGLVLVPPPLLIGSIAATNGGVRLNWTAPTNSQFRVQWTPALSPAAWSDFTNTVSSTNGAFAFFDDGSQTGGAAQTRFYRLLQLP